MKSAIKKFMFVLVVLGALFWDVLFFCIKHIYLIASTLDRKGEEFIKDFYNWYNNERP